MNKIIFKTATIGAVALMTLTTSCMKKEASNPFLTDYTTQYEIPPFEQIKGEHYIPAIEEGIKQQNAEIEAIVKNSEAPTFDNTILAMDESGKLLDKVSLVFGALSESMNDSIMEKIAEQAYPMLAAHSDEILMNDSLFARVKTIYDARNNSGFTTAQIRLIEKNYKTFVRNGALLDPAQKDSLKQYNQDLSSLNLKFSSNILKETNQWTLVVDNKEELAGLPASSIAVAAEEADARGMKGKWIFTLHAPSRLPLLTYADNRSLREKMYKGYTNLASNNNEFNNYKNINELIKVRTKKAKLLGFENYAAYQTDNVMAKTVENAENLLFQIWKPAIEKVKEEVADMQAYATAHGDKITIEPWDYYYYAEKVKKEKFDVNEDEVRPYFQLDSVRNGIFYMAKQLYGITFTEMADAPKYHPEVKVYDVKDAEGKHIAVFMTDYFPRASKRQGAWMSEFKGSSNINGKLERPIIYNVGNFSKPTADTPSLLTLDEVETMFHEFGHALHGMLSKATYSGQSGTNVDRDFVELPSQIHEHWALEPELLKVYAKHYKTGEVIPDALIQKLNAASKFNQGFATTELVGAAILDIEWHKLNDGKDVDVMAFEKSVAQKLNMPKEVQFRYRSPYFKHIFGSDEYSSGYYTYLWAEVLDADGFELFAEKGIFDPATAKAFKENILEAGDSQDPMTLYVNFRGQQPSVDPLLKNRGLK
ncbi:MAG: M3 family metallopeptidase [Muribaculaceae bacterium]|nr:M3 family metallopeptidase [Muribaculaceae bacterium]